MNMEFVKFELQDKMKAHLENIHEKIFSLKSVVLKYFSNLEIIHKMKNISKKIS